MAKSVNPGDLRTLVRFFSVTRTADAEGVPAEAEVNVFGEGAAVRCQWVNAHGSEVFAAQQLQLREPATLTLRYSPLIRPDLIVYRDGDDRPYEIVSVDNVEQRGRWLELKVQRREAAR